MKLLEQFSVRARALGRRVVAPVRIPSRPASLSFRLDDLDAPGPLVPSLDLEGWQERIVTLIQAVGVVPARVVGRADHPLLAEVARFAWRLECPVTVRTTAAGLDADRARALVEAGARTVEILDRDGAAWQDEAGLTGDALRHLARARGPGAIRPDLHVEINVVDVVRHGDPREAAAALRAAGADGVRIGAPWGGGPFPASAIDQAAGWIASLHRTTPATWAGLRRFDGDGPGAPREGGHCPIAARRWELSAEGRLYACPWKEGQALLPAEGPLPDLADHLAAIRSCQRACVHADLG